MMKIELSPMTENLLVGKNLRLRALEPGDVDLLYTWENDTSIWKISNTLVPFSRFQLEEYVLNTQNDIYAARQLRLMIDLNEPEAGSDSIGTIDLFDFDPFNQRAGLGILIRELYREKGYAFEAMQVFIRYAFSTLHMHQLYCNVSVKNVASLNLFEKLGFVQCGLKKDWIREGQGWQEECMLQLIHCDE
jgi:diamine N-acetyltransferase